MATRKSIRQANKKKRPYERTVTASDLDSWSKDKLIAKLKDIGIEVPSNITKNILTVIHAKQEKQ